MSSELALVRSPGRLYYVLFLVMAGSLLLLSFITDSYRTQNTRKEDGFERRKVHRMLAKVNSMKSASPYIDWSRIEDEYIHANLDNEIEHRRLNNRRRRRRRSYNLNKVVGNAVGSATSVVGSSPTREKKTETPFGLDSLLSGALNDAQKVMSSKPVKKETPPFTEHLDAFISQNIEHGVYETKPEEKQNDDNLGVDDDNNRQDNDEGIPIPVYSYSPCQNTVDGLPCAPEDLRERCTKGATIIDDDGTSVSSSFSACFDACEPSFCCIHDAPPDTNSLSPNCNQNPNCSEYAYCYIVWWKFHNTIGLATELRLEGNDDFYDIDANDIPTEVTGLEFFQKLLFHHFDNSDEIIAAGTVQNDDGTLSFSSDLIFLDPNFWDSDFKIKDIPMN